jgi:Family of unknown function (DUF6076)
VKVRLWRGGLLLGERGKPLPLTQPVNDLLGLRDEWDYAVQLDSNYGSFWPDEWMDLPADFDSTGLTDHDLADEARAAQIDRIADEIRELRRRKLPDTFLAACKQAEQGHFSVTLAGFLEQITRRPGDEPDEVPEADLPTLATWALDQALRQRPVEVRECPLCKRPWLASPEQPSPYCDRPYPGRSMSCRALKKDEHFRESQRDWRREYKRLHERRKRGTLSEADWQAWRADNNPDDWYAFDEWQRRRIPVTTATETGRGLGD